LRSSKTISNSLLLQHRNPLYLLLPVHSH
jgi:hypothetical protein